MSKDNNFPKCLDVKSWTLATRKDQKSFLQENIKIGTRRRRGLARNVLVVRKSIRPVDIYCYLKARFGEPNGIQTLLRRDDSDNWIHWDFDLRAGDERVYICGASREVHFMISELMTDRNWKNLLSVLKSDFYRIGKEKSAIFKSLERWVVFPNKFFEIANVCADLHETLVDNIGGYAAARMSFHSKSQIEKSRTEFKRLSERSGRLYRSCLELSLLTPILAEAFINLLILVLCKQEIRDNQRHYSEFIRSHIDVRIFDLPHKCNGFVRALKADSNVLKDFLRIMNKRNDRIHGNCDPEREQIEKVFFDRKCPLFGESGDHLGKFFEQLEAQFQPSEILKDYLGIHAFIAELLSTLSPAVAEGLRRIMEDRYPGYELDRKIIGKLFPEHIMMAGLPGLKLKYDDDL